MKAIRRIWLGFILVAIINLMAGCGPRQVLDFQGKTYQLKSNSDGTLKYVSDDNDTIEISRNMYSDYEQGYELRYNGQIYTVKVSSGRITVKFPDGDELTRDNYNRSSALLGSYHDDITYNDLRIMELAELIVQNVPKGGGNFNSGIFLFGLLFIIIGLLNVIAPELMWKFNVGWQFKNAEPSDLAITMGRIGGVVVIIIAIFVLIASCSA